MKFTTKWMTDYFADYRGVANTEIPIHHIYTDTREKTDRGLFVPLEGETFDGHSFLKSAINNGAVAAFWNKEKPIPEFVPTEFPLFLVDDTLIALQQLAHTYRTEINPKVIGVTGSNGKTTTKDFIASVLSQNYNTHKTNGNFNNHIGLPLTILSMEQGTEVLVLEMGMNHFGEIERLSFISEPDFAVITNIGESHIENLGSREGIAQAKTEILAGLKSNGKVLIDGDEPLLAPLHTREGVLSCGFDEKNKYVLSDCEMDDAGTRFTINEEADYSIQVPGKHNVKNASFAIIIGELLNMKQELIQEGLSAIELTGMRLERVLGKKGATILNDAYNASPTSMKASIDVVKELPNFSRKILVLGDIFELGALSEMLHRSIADAISEPIDMVIAIGEEAPFIVEEMKKKELPIETHSFQTKEEAVEILQSTLSDETVILLKASRLMAFESLLEHLSDKE
ncbi:UDP-N-acetylmuramoyl-tripeptide--D-alanyl-D-alanine ligase [Pontibacillus yanchengensis]|uniref:UDP-N-acetylmuramoyl-tripeptide--D-alanyl-D-alanine ligase n=2 Tax=Pontibacillus yanchengensis TaxID=462910 RepID=A0ACC7VDT7_9BACI|nr:UDP-N-acetylmuramoyl-tripeptide--D-alanyl-D-alanine ligase [Pontibacillus yanchengensis]MYL33046.1 UDP-N-acetylmuramoyl-tripeptide--D-alanyl-D-alanine ligase [Pontibacillus yanchengensis]MYL52104.1 UDP-N-acetylmuramoyl-tripeptide--D-alanyl-D-alanine ligase [Pontibacillus yanchengensis]